MNVFEKKCCRPSSFVCINVVSLQIMRYFLINEKLIEPLNDMVIPENLSLVLRKCTVHTKAPGCPGDPGFPGKPRGPCKGRKKYQFYALSSLPSNFLIKKSLNHCIICSANAAEIKPVKKVRYWQY